MSITPEQRGAIKYISWQPAGATPMNGNHRRTFAALTLKGLAYRVGERWFLTDIGWREARR